MVVAVVLGLTGTAGVGLPETLLTWFSLLVVLLVAVVVPWLAGRFRHQQVELAQAGWERAEQLEREQRIVAERERLRERARIAQDMHDSLGHELSLVALRAGALELATDLDEQHRRAAGELRSAAATATQRLHEIIGVLREDGAQPPLEPAGETVAELVDRARASGMAVQLTTTGSAGTQGLTVDRVVYRVVQEALTNAARHAAGASVTVHLEYGEETVVTVTNTAGSATGPGGGRGLAALAERVRLVGGTLVAGPCDGGFAVHARLPRSAPATPDPRLSDSAWHRELAQHELRRRLATAVGVPVVLGAALAVVSLAYYAAVTHYSVLEPAEFALLRVGAERASVEPLLPPIEMIDPPSWAGPPAPEGASCRFYRSSAEILAIHFGAYRVCFDGGVLVTKDAITAVAAGYTG